MFLLKKKTLTDILNISDNDTKIKELYKFLSKKSKYGKAVDELNEVERKIYLIMEFEAEMNDGGFEQYFSSEIADYMYELCDDLKGVGEIKAYEILNEAIQLFPCDVTVSTNRKKVLEMLLNEQSLFNTVNDKYYEAKINFYNTYLTCLSSIEKSA
jgi:hypothetical protein